ncbi:MAG: TdeIII family type II restriction endonuclease [Chloroflexi bacterium]|nr:TdeIII family type II restriction endonuclease [Chloroflexota bacterium]MCA2001256.1 TdeIII family type II restriction endonuclease [Chloroflexota bacterium]
MPLLPQQSAEIEQLLKEQIRRKLADYAPETNNMPFHTRLLGKDRMALFSFIQSINTSLGTSVFEQVAAVIAKPHFRRAVHQYKDFNTTISAEAQAVIQQMIDDLRTARSKPNKPKEIAKILSVAQKGTLKKVKRPRIDLFLEDRDGTEYYFDLKTAKPNIDEIVGFKRKMLEWVAIRGAIPPKPKIYTGLAIPYNPYEPEPYDRWTFQGMFDLTNEIKVADEFWNFLGGEKTYEQLLDVFEKVGLDLRPEIDQKFASFASKR